MTSDLEFAYERLSSITSDDPLARPRPGHREAIVNAVFSIGAHDGFHVAESFPKSETDSFPDALRQLALASEFRFRKVSLEGGWWRQEGPSLVAWRTSTDTPVALIWRRRRYHVQDPELGEFNHMSKALAHDNSKNDGMPENKKKKIAYSMWH